MNQINVFNIIIKRIGLILEKLKLRKMKNFTLFQASMILITLFFFVSCTKDEDDPADANKVDISGQILNVTDIGVKGATIKFTNGDQSFTATTDDNGNYSLSGISEATYTVSVDATGYNTTTENSIVVSSGAMLNFELLGNATVSGKVLNSQTGQGVANAEITFYEAGKKSTDDFVYVVFRLYADAYGIYHLGELPEGIFNVRMSAPGFNNNDIENVQLFGGENNIGESTIVEQVAEGDVRIVLSWGETPYDLDSHFTGPTSGTERFHVYYSNEYVNDGTSAYLDVDDTESFGPETITISEYLPGVYRYSVHNYSNDGTDGGQEIYNSPAKVEIFDSNGLIASFNPKPFTAGTGNTWRVFEFTISNDIVSITTIDEYIYAESEDDIDSFKSNQFKPESIFNLGDF